MLPLDVGGNQEHHRGAVEDDDDNDVPACSHSVSIVILARLCVVWCFQLAGLFGDDIQDIPVARRNSGGGGVQRGRCHEKFFRQTEVEKSTKVLKALGCYCQKGCLNSVVR